MFSNHLLCVRSLCARRRRALGTRFLTDCLLEMDKMNAIAASRIAKPFTEWRLYDQARQDMMKGELKRILDSNPSPNLYEICTKSLA